MHTDILDIPMSVSRACFEESTFERFGPDIGIKHSTILNFSREQKLKSLVSALCLNDVILRERFEFEARKKILKI